MKSVSAKKIAFTAAFGALCFVVTYAVAIPIGIGYLNFGDVVVLLAGWLLGPLFGAIAAGIGASLSDLLLGYIVYFPATLITKALVAVIAGAIARKCRFSLLGYILSAFVAEIFMMAGYFAYEALLYSAETAVASLLSVNLLQGCVCAAVGAIAVFVLDKTSVKKRFFAEF